MTSPAPASLLKSPVVTDGTPVTVVFLETYSAVSPPSAVYVTGSKTSAEDTVVMLDVTISYRPL